MKHFLCTWTSGLSNKKTSNVVDHVILSIVIAYMTVCSYVIRFNMYLEISVTGQYQN